MNAGDRTRAVVVLVRDNAEVVIGRVAGRECDLTLVDRLARLQLCARRLGCSIRLRDLCPELRRLLEVVGLADVLAGEPRLSVEAGGEAEGGEQLGVEEVMEPRDPPV